MRPLTQEDKKKLYFHLAEAYMSLLKEGKLGKFERKVISKKILEQMKVVKTFNDVQELVDDLAKNYPPFKTAAVQVKSHLSSFQEKKVIQNLEQYFTNLSKHA